MKITTLVWVVLLVTGSGIKSLLAGNATVPGTITTPYPTLENLAVEWAIDGDDNNNGVVTVRYRSTTLTAGRKTGDTAWREGMPLRRVPAGKALDRTITINQYWTNRHTGSIFNLSPDTEYEISLRLTDPDGGNAEQTVHARTRPVPAPMPGAPVKNATPKNFKEIVSTAQPGDIILLASGHYGMLTVTCDGLPGKPIVFKADPMDLREGAAAGAGGHKEFVFFDGISLQDRKHVYLDGLVSTGTIDLFNAEECVVQRCRVMAVTGIVSSWNSGLAKWSPQLAARVQNPSVKEGVTPTSCRNCYIADNVVMGITLWEEQAFGAIGKNVGEGIEITGPGNVICYNRVIGFRDAISTMEGKYVVEQVCIDIYNNDISAGSDDGIEADFCMNNCRIYRNRIVNCHHGLSSQPSLGGPTYFIRNVMYNMVGNTYKLMRYSVGDVILHNTVVKTGDAATFGTGSSQALSRNNLMIGGKVEERFTAYGNGKGLAANIRAGDDTFDYDYDGFGVIGMPFEGNIGGKMFNSLASLRSNTTEKHGVQVDLNVFAAPVALPDPPLPGYLPPDLRLRAGSAAVDAGQVIPNITDGYAGSAPDLGAYELGQGLPVYGPREFEEN